MSMNVEDMTAEQLHEYARDELGVDLSKNPNEEAVRERVKAEAERQGLAPVSLETPKPKRRRKAKAAVKDPKADWPMIHIHKTDDPNEEDPVFVGVNAVGFTINRGEDVKVPPAVVEALRNAKKDVYFTKRDKFSNKPYLEKRVALAKPFSIVG